MNLLSQIFAGVAVTISLGDAVTLGLAVIGFIAWLIRLESKTSWNEKDIIAIKAEQTRQDDERKAEIEKIETAVWEKFETAQNTMNEILIALGRLEGKIESKDAR
ncbi:MAG: hypothetical protein ACKOX6_15910 [Bdellovibrio sp.]